MNIRNKIILFLPLLLLLVVCSPVRSNRSYDAELSDALLSLREGSPSLDEISNIKIYSLPKNNRWPSMDDLKSDSLIFETETSIDIIDCINNLRKHSDGSVSSQILRSSLAILVTMKDGRIAFVKVLIYSDSVYVIPFPSKDEYGVHGFISKPFLDYLEKKELITN